MPTSERTETSPSGRPDRALRILYMMGFVFTLSMSIPLYVNSTYLETLLPEQGVGLVFTAGALLAFLILVFAPRILAVLGNYRVMFLIGGAMALLLLVVGFTEYMWTVIPAFILYYSLLPAMYFSFDVFVERYSATEHTGRIRALFLSAINLAIFSGPLVASFVLTDGHYWRIYALAATFATILLMFLLASFSRFSDPEYRHPPFLRTLHAMWCRPRIYAIFMANLLLRFFYGWMAIYLPLYLHAHVGFSWGVLGVIIAIALVPFLLFQIPAGKLADTMIGEKEMMIVGFILMGLSTIGVSFISAPVFWLWATVLFIGRTGASLVEITTESYFFKHVQSEEGNILGFFRINRPIAIITAPLIASAALFVMPLQYIFIMLGVIMLGGIWYAYSIVDTR